MPDVFGLRAFDSREPIFRMFPGQFPNQLHVMIPNAGAAPVDFHDIIMSDLRTTPEWRARRIILSDVTSLRRSWPNILFATMHKRQADMENLRRLCRHRLERAFSHGRPGYCPQCKEYMTGALDRHMMNNHLELGQLWRCPVEWCAVWKGSVGDCLDHMRGKHGGSQCLALKNLGKFFPRGLFPVISGM